MPRLDIPPEELPLAVLWACVEALGDGQPLTDFGFDIHDRARLTVIAVSRTVRTFRDQHGGICEGPGCLGCTNGLIPDGEGPRRNRQNRHPDRHSGDQSCSWHNPPHPTKGTYRDGSTQAPQAGAPVAPAATAQNEADPGGTR